MRQTATAEHTLLLTQLRRREAEILSEEGLSTRQIAAQMGIGYSTVYRYLNPEYERKTYLASREAKRRRTGKCEVCGATTHYNGKGGQNGASKRCPACAQQPKFWTREAVIDAIQRFAAENGRPPTASEWMRANKEKGYPSAAVVYHTRGKKRQTAAFRKWNDAIAAAGFEPLKIGHYRRPERRYNPKAEKES